MTVPGRSNDRAFIRPISARSIAAARRVTQDYARPFCTVKAATARGFCENLTTNLGSRPARASMALSRKKARTKKKEMRADPLDLEPFVQRTTSNERLAGLKRRYTRKAAHSGNRTLRALDASSASVLIAIAELFIPVLDNVDG